MSRVKFGLVSVLAMLAALVVCGIAASGASAVEWELTTKLCTGGTNVNFCYEKTATELAEFKGTGEFEILPPATAILFKSNLGEAVEIECKGVDAEHSPELADGLILQPKPLEADTTLEFILNFLECTLLGALGKLCKIPATKTSNVLIGEFDLLESKLPDDNEITFKPKVPNIFIGIPFEDNKPEKCPATVIGTRNVTGEILCFFDKEEKEVLEDLKEHTLICDPAKGGQAGKLFFASSENPATLLAELEIAILNIGTDLWNISNEA